MMLRGFIWLRIGPLVSKLFNLMLPCHAENSQQFVGHVHPSLFACSNFAFSQIRTILRGGKANHWDPSVERRVRVVRQLEQHGVQVVTQLEQHCVQGVGQLEQHGVQVVRQLGQHGVQVVRQLEQHGVQGVAGKQKDSHRNVCANKRHSRNNKTFWQGSIFHF